MRLRKLAQGQTLMFIAPPEVHKNIVEITGKTDTELDSYDVVQWALEQSCVSIGRSQPLRILQGLNHNRCQVLMDRFIQYCQDLSMMAQQINVSSGPVTALREREEQGLKDLYAPISLRVNKTADIVTSSQGRSDYMVQTLLRMWKGLHQEASEGATMHEEHEREVAHEIEQETQVERPPKVNPHKRAVDPRLREFVRTGFLASLMRFSLAYDRVVKTRTSVELPGNTKAWARLRVTADFANTVESPQSGCHDNYLRPVNWVLTSNSELRADALLIISPFEANELLRDIQAPGSGVRLHVYEPRVTKSMRSVDFGAWPAPASMEQWQRLGRGLRRELNLFAGQLYFNERDDHEQLCKEVLSTLNSSMEKTQYFIKAWIAIRRKGQNFLQTHVGQIVSGRSLKGSAFE